MNPRAKSAKAIKDFEILVEFTNGEIKRFDMRPLLIYPVYRPLFTPSYLKKVFVSNGIVQWPNEEDLCPDTLYIEGKKVP